MTKKIKVSLTVEVEPADTFFLRTHLGNVTDEKTGEKFEVSLSINNTTTFFEFKDAIYIISLKNLCNSVLESRKVKQG